MSSFSVFSSVFLSNFSFFSCRKNEISLFLSFHPDFSFFFISFLFHSIFLILFVNSLKFFFSLSNILLSSSFIFNSFSLHLKQYLFLYSEIVYAISIVSLLSSLHVVHIFFFQTPFLIPVCSFPRDRFRGICALFFFLFSLLFFPSFFYFFHSFHFLLWLVIPFFITVISFNTLSFSFSFLFDIILFIDSLFITSFSPFFFYRIFALFL
ncbi:unnamed protein product [Acanthosepion pharaonis]|uniref:Uncharacterized protein n=1 Tax=Acanthosepion pharaonis TaxID=158019 RepID=A0A812DMR6_ACAPH|nr:unnamed protein product [Sepia pharaonis]